MRRIPPLRNWPHRSQNPEEKRDKKQQQRSANSLYKRAGQKMNPAAQNILGQQCPANTVAQNHLGAGPR
eukprot:918319-Heterocapsa_arctica.AAC.1